MTATFDLKEYTATFISLPPPAPPAGGDFSASDFSAADFKTT